LPNTDHLNISRGARTVRRIAFHLLLALPLLPSAAVQAQTSSTNPNLPADPSSYSRTSAFEYDPTTGLLVSETVEPDIPSLCVKTTYIYDAYGNKTSATTANCASASGSAIFTTRANSSTFDAQTAAILTGSSGVPLAGGASVPAGAFPTTSKNALNQSQSVTYDPRFGAKISLTGPNGLTTIWQVDDLGRTYKETRADGTNTITLTCYLAGRVSDTSSNYNCGTPNAAEVPADAASFVSSEVHNGQDSKISSATRVYMDRAGRKIRTVSEAFDGSTQALGPGRLIVQDTEYNAQGVQEVVTNPYFFDTLASTGAGTGGFGMSSTVYDVLGRPTSVYTTDPKGSQVGQFGAHGGSQAAVTSMQYNGLTTTITDDQQHTRVEEKNIDGKLARITDAQGAQVANFYDIFGNLANTKDALQNIVTIQYDIRGRKVSMSDPDTGTWTYDYDALGELIRQQSPNQAAQSTATTMSYDVLGRMTQRVDPNEYTSSWFYDAYANGACYMGIGKLCESQTTSGIDRKIVYDNLGRSLSTRTDISGGPSFASASTYDGNGRVASQTYPTGLTVNYAYTANGFLSTLNLAPTAQINPLPAVAGGTATKGPALAAKSLLWQGLSYNAWGKIEQQLYGNGVTGNTSFDGIKGLATGSTAGATGGAAGSDTAVMNYSYGWDSLNRLVSRTDANGDGTTGAVSDTMAYDSIGRLQNYTVTAPQLMGNAERNVTFQYNALGSVLLNSDVGVYQYPVQGAGHPHALQNVSGAGFNSNYGYDANGNMITASAGSYSKITYNSFNLPDSQTGLQGPAGGPQYTWQYDENHQRIKEVRTDSGGTRTTWLLHPDNAGGLAFESEQNGAIISNRHYLTAAGNSIGVLVSTDNLPTLASGQTVPPPMNLATLDKVEYWHKDYLGSLIATSDHGGAVTARYSYDPFGKRRTASGSYDAAGKLVYDWNNTSSGTDRGYTGHQHLDDVGLIHMNGRIFDPRLGIFMQGDPFIQDPTNLQNFNRYGYCYNNPLTCTDSTGYLFGGLFNVPIIDNLWNNHIKAALPAIASIVIDIYAPELLAAEFGATPLEQAAITGFASGAVSSGNLKGALQGGFTSVMFFGVGQEFQGYMTTSGAITDYGKYAEAIAAHAVVGCVGNVMGGGKCGAGAISAALSKAVVPITGPMGKDNLLGGVAISAVVGGTASVLGGGKFSNGAETAAMGYLENYCRSGQCDNPLDELKNSPIGQFWNYVSNIISPPPPPDYISASVNFYVASGGFTVNLHDGDINGQFGLGRAYPSPSLTTVGYSLTFGSIVGQADASSTKDFLSGGAIQATYFVPLPIEYLGIGGGVTHSYSGGTAIEYGIGSPGANINLLGYGTSH
jgi:RHS repeat-associated protein